MWKAANRKIPFSLGCQGAERLFKLLVAQVAKSLQSNKARTEMEWCLLGALNITKKLCTYVRQRDMKESFAL